MTTEESNLFVDRQGNAHVTVFSSVPPGLHHIYQSSGTWQREFIPWEASATPCGIVLDRHDRLVMAYIEVLNTTIDTGRLHLRMGDGSRSIVQDEEAFDCRIAMDASNAVHMVYVLRPPIHQFGYAVYTRQ